MSDATPPASLAEALYGPNGPVRDGPAGAARAMIDAGIAKPAAEQPLPDRFNGQPAKIGGQGLVLPEAPQQFDPDKLTIPEGLEADPALVGEFSTAAKELGLNHKGAERMVELHAKAVRAGEAAWERQAEQWRAEVERDPEIGNERALGTVRSLLRDPQLTDPEALRMLDYTQLGNNPAVIRTLYRWASEIERLRNIARGRY